MKEKTQKNIYKAFIGEAKAYFRLLAYAERAKEEDLPQVALLFLAIAEAEKVHAIRQLNLVKEDEVIYRFKTPRDAGRVTKKLGPGTASGVEQRKTR